MNKQILRLWKLLDQRMHYRCFFILAIMIIGSLIEVLGIGMMLPVLELAVDPDASLKNNKLLADLNDIIGFTLPTSFMIFLCIGVFIVYLAKNLFTLLIINEQYKFTWGLLTHFTHRLFRQYLEAPYTAHIKRNSALLLRNINHSVPGIFSALLMPILLIVSETLVAISLLSFLIWLQPVIAISAIAALAFVALVFLKVFKRRLKNWAERNQTSRGEMLYWPNQAFSGFKSIKALGRESYFVREFARSAHANAHSQRNFALVNHIPRALMEIFAIGGILLFLAVFLALGKDLEEQIPVIGAFSLAVIRVLPIATRIITQFNLVKHGVAAMELVYEDLSGLPRESDPIAQENVQPMALNSELRIENVHYTYDDNKIPALHNIDLKIPKGSSIAFVGASGAGKSTLADIILGLIEPTKGRILVDGVDIADNIHAWRKACGYIPQEVFLLDDTLRRNIALGLDEIDDAAVQRAAVLAHLSGVISELPDGFGTSLGENGVRLSGGQRQRVSIARSLYRDPNILILDEATAALDSETEKEIASAIDQFFGEKTLIIIAHRLSTIQHCEKIVFLKEGRIQDIGSFEELVSKNPDFQRMVQLGNLMA
jgi:ATP-binding cassette, subfamily B, bacterial PglK